MRRLGFWTVGFLLLLVALAARTVHGAEKALREAFYGSLDPR